MNENERFMHNQYTFNRWADRGLWDMDTAWNLSDVYREMAALAEAGIPQDAMHVVEYEHDRVGGRRYRRLTIDCSADEQVRAFADRLHQAWLTQKAIDDERYAKQYEEAQRNQQAQGVNDFEWTF